MIDHCYYFESATPLRDFSLQDWIWIPLREEFPKRYVLCAKPVTQRRYVPFC